MKKLLLVVFIIMLSNFCIAQNNDSEESASKDTSPEVRNISMDFSDIHIGAFSQFVCMALNKELIIDPSINTTVTVKKKVALNELYPFFLSVLKENNLFATEEGDSIIISY